MYKKVVITTLFVLCGLLPEWVAANGASSLLNDIYNNKSTLSNVTKPQVVQGQQAGYLTGGSLVTRSPSKTLHPANVTLPRVSVGCQGIDFYTGGISFVNTKEFVDTFKSIANGTKGYAVQMALETLSPMMASSISKVKGIADEVNRFNINSCETASLLVGAAAPKLQTARHHACAQVATQNGKLADYVRSKHNCGTNEQQASQLNAAPRDKQRELRFNVNLIWDALEKNGMVKSDAGLSEWMMSLSGTKIYRQRHGHPDVQQLPSTFLSDPNHHINSLLHGGSIKRYHCDDTKKCLSPKTISITVTPGDSLQAKVDKMMHSIAGKIQSGESLTAAETQFINNVSLPVYKLIDLSTMTSRGDGYIDIGSYAEVIALDWLITQCEQLTHSVRAAAMQSDLQGDDVIALSENLKAILKALEQARTTAFQKQGDQSHLFTLLRQLEQYRHGQQGATVAHALKEMGETS